MARLSERRQRILDFITEFIDERGYSPTVREIMGGCGISSPAVVQHHLSILQREGVIHRDADISRGMRLTQRQSQDDIVEIPLLGTIAAGEPIPVPHSDSWVAEAEERLRLPLTLLSGKSDVYALRIKGTSMIDALIDDGDIVIIEPARTADDGTIVAIWLKNRQETTFKRIYRESGHLRLQPANPQMEPILVAPEDVEIQGKLLRVIR
jgi:repressor LexA